MIPVGYLAKRVRKKPDWLGAAQVVDVYSVSGCVSEDFADYINFWKHNGYWLFDSPEVIRSVVRENRSVVRENAIELEGTSLFYYKAHEMRRGTVRRIRTRVVNSNNVIPPSEKIPEGFDVVTFYARNAPECSPLSCSSIAKEIQTNAHCLFDSFDEAYANVSNGAFKKSEPGPLEYSRFIRYHGGSR